MSHNITRRPVGDSGCPYTGLESETANPTRPSSPTIPPSPSVESETADITRSRSPSISSPPSSPLTTQPRNGSSTVTPEDDVGDGTPDASNATTNKDEHMDKRSHATSQWKVDWKTPSLLIASYFAALGAAVGHLIWFLKLDGTHTEDYSISQGYVITISTLLATLWSLCLSACLSVVSTQGFWSLVRKRYLAVKHIEQLYGLFRNIFLFRPKLMTVGPLMYAIAILAWSLSFVKTLPPGSLIVEYVPFSNTSDATIPAFNSSDVGNGTIQDALDRFPAANNLIFSTGGPRLVPSNPTKPYSWKRALQRYFNSGELATYASPCGSNCSFVFDMEAPHLECTNSGYNTTIDTKNSLIVGQNSQLIYDLYRSSYNISTLRIQTFNPIDVPVVLNGDMNSSMNFTVASNETRAYVNDTVCQFATAIYTVNVSYVNNIQSIVHSTRPLGVLNFTSACSDSYAGFINIEGLSCGINGTGVMQVQEDESITGNYTLNKESQQNIRALKTHVMTQNMLDVLKGMMPAICSLDNSADLIDGRNPLSCNLGNVNSTIAPIIDTFFYGAIAEGFGPSTFDNGAIPSLYINPDILNAAVFNTTMVYMYSSVNHQNQTTSPTQNYVLPTFIFSRQLNLILPYFIPLGLAIPAVIYAFFLLYHSHHVAAMDDSFIQILMTTTGSPTLTTLASGGCLGGDNNIPKELEKLRIKYGDITSPKIGEGETGVRQAGFGTEGEVTNLDPRAVYGSKHA